jgi:calcineurin-like phosphoesterase family protein
MHLPQDLNDHIVKTTNKTIGIIEQVFKYGVERGEFPATLNLRKNRNAVWGMLNGIISLHLFTGAEDKRAEIIRDTVKAGLEILIRGLDISDQPR